MPTALKEMARLMHRDSDALPWIEFDRGIKTQFLHIDEESGIFAMHSRAEPGYQGRLHRHVGDVFAVTVSGAWKYLEHPEINKAGSYLYEPDKSYHTFKSLDDNEEITEFWAIVQGGLEYIDDEGNLLSTLDAAAARRLYEDACTKQGLPAPDPLGAVE
jgi:hypothetical protein